MSKNRYGPKRKALGLCLALFCALLGGCGHRADDLPTLRAQGELAWL